MWNQRNHSICYTKTTYEVHTFTKHMKYTLSQQHMKYRTKRKGIITKIHFCLSFSRLYLFVRSCKFVITDNRNMHFRHSTWWERNELINHSKYIIGSAWKQPSVIYNKSCWKHLCWGLSLTKNFKATLKKRDSNSGVFLRNLQKF